jgi:hypothetical protein
MDALLSRAGFRSVETMTEVTDIVYAHEDDWWDFLLTMAPRPALLSMEESTRARFRREYLDLLRSLFREDGLHLPVSMVYATARH